MIRTALRTAIPFVVQPPIEYQVCAFHGCIIQTWLEHNELGVGYFCLCNSIFHSLSIFQRQIHLDDFIL
jgi:hypothetical protein